MKKHTSFCLIIFIALLSCNEMDLPAPWVENPFLIEPGTKPLIAAHGGSKHLNPENTMLAFQNSADMGVDILEMDVSLTADSILVCIHDLTIDATSDGTGDVFSYTFEELQAFNFGANFQALDGTFPHQDNPVRIPKLEDVLATFPDFKMIIEIKNSGDLEAPAGDKVKSLVDQYNRQKSTVVFSFSGSAMDYFHSINNTGIITGGSFSDGFDFMQSVEQGTHDSIPIRADMFAFPTELLGNNLSSLNIVEAAHSRNVALHYWTINDKEEMKQLINRGVDGIITDRPDLMLEALSELGF